MPHDIPVGLSALLVGIRDATDLYTYTLSDRSWNASPAPPERRAIQPHQGCTPDVGRDYHHGESDHVGPGGGPVGRSEIAVALEVANASDVTVGPSHAVTGRSTEGRGRSVTHARTISANTSGNCSGQAWVPLGMTTPRADGYCLSGFKESPP